VTERSEESDLTSNLSSVDLNSSVSSYDDGSSDTASETYARIKMAENIKVIEKMANEIFKTAPIPFKFDFEDYENCRLNGEIKKMISYMNITIPIVPVQDGGSRYFIGVKHVNLELKGAFIHVKTDEESIRFNDYISKNHKLFAK